MAILMADEDIDEWTEDRREKARGAIQLCIASGIVLCGVVGAHVVWWLFILVR